MGLSEIMTSLFFTLFLFLLHCRCGCKSWRQTQVTKVLVTKEQSKFASATLGFGLSSSVSSLTWLYLHLLNSSNRDVTFFLILVLFVIVVVFRSFPSSSAPYGADHQLSPPKTQLPGTSPPQLTSLGAPAGPANGGVGGLMSLIQQQQQQSNLRKTCKKVKTSLRLFTNIACTRVANKMCTLLYNRV